MTLPIAITEADGFALSMIGILTLSLMTLLGIFVAILRSAAKRDPEVEALIEEVTRTAPPTPVGSPEPSTHEPWEREGDWWKKG
ncbi:hypothetical protein HNR46_001140 [Haloferula luteola]|uniref:Uncharacterized protein n=1 Tax=Haloferula luteola TaxID=595692 RepID=A0A840V1H0_9BACT|nr:hypothetical protein [Haloferula luteola]MBB5350906.1 hypothetical protein [Haloferula luteola]